MFPDPTQPRLQIYFVFVSCVVGRGLHKMLFRTKLGLWRMDGSLCVFPFCNPLPEFLYEGLNIMANLELPEAEFLSRFHIISSLGPGVLLSVTDTCRRSVPKKGNAVPLQAWTGP
jgi:hypothetical protein